MFCDFYLVNKSNLATIIFAYQMQTCGQILGASFSNVADELCVCEMCHERAYNVKRRRRGEYGKRQASRDEKVIFIMISFGLLWGGTRERRIAIKFR